jgi:photosystem II stability/assembly factor-like uncharacterized protein
MRLLPIATAGVTLALSAPSAAFAPKLQITLDPATASKAPAITAAGADGKVVRQRLARTVRG